jgi:hypothetical protein
MHPRFLCMLLLFFLVAHSCRKPELPEIKFQIYTIPAGKHHSGNGLELFHKEKMTFEVVFDSSAIYSTFEKSNQEAINKLYGFSDYNSGHQLNSARIGWRWFNDKLEIWAYSYSQQERLTKLITSFELNKPYKCSIEINGSEYLFNANGEHVKLERKCTHKNGIKYKLYPYFGGTETAPHDIVIKIKDL